MKTTCARHARLCIHTARSDHRCLPVQMVVVRDGKPATLGEPEADAGTAFAQLAFCPLASPVASHPSE